MKVNWRRGIVRLWLVLSIIWCFGTIALGDSLDNLTTLWELRDVEYDSQEVHEKEYYDLTINQQYFRVKKALRNAQKAGKEAEMDADKLQRFLQNEFLEKKAHAGHTLKRTAIVALMPPCIVLVFGLSGLWVIRGWRATDQARG